MVFMEFVQDYIMRIIHQIMDVLMRLRICYIKLMIAMT